MRGYILIKAPRNWERIVDQLRFDRRVVRANVVKNAERSQFRDYNYDIVLEVADDEERNLWHLLKQVRDHTDGVGEAVLLLTIP